MCQMSAFICVTWLIHMCDMTHSYVWHDPCIWHWWPLWEVGGWGRDPFSRNFMKPTPRRKWYLTTGRRFHWMVLDPIPQSLPVHFFGSRPQPPTSHHCSISAQRWVSESYRSLLQKSPIKETYKRETYHFKEPTSHVEMCAKVCVCDSACECEWVMSYIRMSHTFVCMTWLTHTHTRSHRQWRSPFYRSLLWDSFAKETYNFQTPTFAQKSNSGHTVRSRHTHVSVTPRVSVSESCHTYECVWRDPLICVTWLIYMWNMTHTNVCD